MIERKNAWIFLPIIFSLTVTYISFFLSFESILHKGNNEIIAIILMSIVPVILFSLVLLSRFAFIYSFFFILALNFLIRELDASVWNLPIIGEFKLRTKEYIYFAICIMFLWAIWKIEKVQAFFSENPFARKLFLSMFITYLFSQLVARRIFRNIFPDEKQIHIPLEEITENFAHFVFLLFAITILIYFIKKVHSKRKSILFSGEK
ncbi:MAG TPA: hypothetical protein P5105_02105 [Victivallales bacterium]|nr:hypothetical protein [Victivallales bacterium]